MAKLRVVVNSEGMLDVMDAPHAEEPLQPEERRLMSALNRAMMETNSRLRPETREKIRKTINIPAPVQWEHPDLHPSLYLDLFPRGELVALARECEREMLAVAATVESIEQKEGRKARLSKTIPDATVPTPKQEKDLSPEELADMLSADDVDAILEEEDLEKEEFLQQVAVAQETARRAEELRAQEEARKEEEAAAIRRLEASEKEDEHPCPHCDFVAGSKVGLASHVRHKHKEVDG